jgi:import inner membrane translocase subunit TIM9
VEVAGPSDEDAAPPRCFDVCRRRHANARDQSRLTEILLLRAQAGVPIATTFSLFEESMDLNPAEQARLEVMMQKTQQKEFMKMFFRVTADCFDTCITDFSSKALSPRDVARYHSKLTAKEGCIARCTDKFMKSSERIGLRFSEENQKLMQQGMPGSLGR